MAQQICAFMQKVREMNFYKRPGVAETLDWASALIALNRKQLDDKSVIETMGCVFKYREDLNHLREQVENRQFNLDALAADFAGVGELELRWISLRKQSRSAVNKVASVRGKGTLPNIMAFGRALKHLGVKVSLSQVLDASRSADFVDIAERGDFRALLRANLISQKEDFPVFDMLFDCFWREQSYERVPMETMDIQGTPTESQAQEGGDEEGGMEEAATEAIAKENLPLENLDEFAVPTYSAQELMNRKDFSEMGAEESRAIARAILLIATKIATQISRRKKIGRKGPVIDPRCDHAAQHEIRRRSDRDGRIANGASRKPKSCCCAMSAVRWIVTAGF